MSKILPEFKQNLIQDILESIEANVSHYYAFASHPLEYSNGIPTAVDSDYDTSFINSWIMLGQRILYMKDMIIPQIHYLQIQIIILSHLQMFLVDIIIFTNVLIMLIMLTLL